MGSNPTVSMLIPLAPDEFWAALRKVVKEEIQAADKLPNRKREGVAIVESQIAGKTLYGIAEVCALFNVSRETVHQWVKSGKLRKIKVRSKVFFQSSEIHDIIKKPR
ncbi:MAG: helix-turn-helix domain-containing protein [Bacteroidota bacterium]